MKLVMGNTILNGKTISLMHEIMHEWLLIP